MHDDAQDYVSFFQSRLKTPFSLLWPDLLAHLEVHSKQSLDTSTAEQLARYEDSLDSTGFFDTLKRFRQRLPSATAQFLYHRFIRLLFLQRIDDSHRGIYAPIPIVLLPYCPTLEAFITMTPSGPVICFSDAFNGTLLGIYQTLAKTSDFALTQTSTPQLGEDEAVNYVLSIIEYVSSCFAGNAPRDLPLDEPHYVISDIWNNHAHLFTLAHEYSHFSLGHLAGASVENQQVSLRGAPLPVVTRTLLQDIEADSLAISYLKYRGDSQGDFYMNSALGASVEVLFLTFSLLRLARGLSESSLQNIAFRSQKALGWLFHDMETIGEFQEANVLKSALRRLSGMSRRRV